MCPRCLTQVFRRRTSHQRPHWGHYAGTECTMRRDAISGHGHTKRTAAELETFAPTGAHLKAGEDD
ncbi:hypothetical protein ACWDA7_01045 [Streptomyces sp. NPDC001156]